MDAARGEGRPCEPERAGKHGLMMLKSPVERMVEMATGKRIRIRGAEISTLGRKAAAGVGVAMGAAGLAAD